MARLTRNSAKAVVWLGARDHRAAMGLLLLSAVIGVQAVLQLVMYP